MADFTTLLNEIKASIYDNTDGDITGQVLQDVLINIVETINSSLPSDSNEETITLLSHVAQIKTSDTLDTFYGKGLQIGTASQGVISQMDGNDCFVISMGWPTGGAYAVQIAIDDGSHFMVMRYCKSGTWSSWVTVYPQSGGSDGSSIELTANRIVETDDEGKLGVSKYSVDTLIEAIEDMDGAIWDVVNSNKAKINAIADTDAEEYEFAGIVIVEGSSGDLIYNTDMPSDSDKIGKGKVVFIGSENISSSGTTYKDHFAYQVQGGLTTSDYTYYMLFSNDNYGNAYTSYQFNSNIPKYFRNTEDGKLYTWSGGTMVVTEGTMSGVGMQLGSISESKLNDDASAKLNAGGMLPFEAMLTSLLTSSQIDNISVINVDYIQAATDTSPMHVYYYQDGSNIGFFVAMSELSVNDAVSGITAPAYTRFVGSEMYNDYSGLESGSLTQPVAREDQMYLIKGSNGGVYRYIGNVKSFVKLF